MKKEVLEARIDSINEKIEKEIALVQKYQIKVNQYQKEKDDFANNRIVPKRYKDTYNLIGTTDTRWSDNGREEFVYSEEQIVNAIQHELEYDVNSAIESLNNHQKQLNEYETTLNNYQEQLKEVEDKENNTPNIKEIWEFLDKFEEQVKEWCKYQIDTYNKEVEQVYEDDREYQEKIVENGIVNYDVEDDETLIPKHIDLMEDIIDDYSSIPNWLMSCCREDRSVRLYNYINTQKFKYKKSYYSKVESRYFKLSLDESELDKLLDEDKKAKYNMFMEQIIPITGTHIKEVKFMSIGEKGDLNGTIVGDDGVAKVLTFSAGGYNIQCYHFRTRVTRLK